MTTDNHIYDWLHSIGHQIAKHAAPIRDADGDHLYDGAIAAVWDGIHEALGLDPDEFIDCTPASHDRHCEMLYSKQGDSLRYTGDPTRGGLVPLNIQTKPSWTASNGPA